MLAYSVIQHQAPHPEALATTGDPLLPWGLIGLVAAFLPYPDTLSFLLVLSKVTAMVHPGLCYLAGARLP